jgi:hypothetical protein
MGCLLFVYSDIYVIAIIYGEIAFALLSSSCYEDEFIAEISG